MNGQMGANNRDWSVLIFSIFVLFHLFPSRYGYVIYNLTQFQSLSQGDTLVSPSQVFELGFFSPKDSLNQYLGIWYRGISPKTVVWVANRENPLRNTDSQASMVIGSRGNIELFDANNASVWSTDVEAPSNSLVATLSDYGNLLLNNGKSGDGLWQSFDHLGNTFLPSSVLGFDVKTKKSYVLTSWKSENDPSPGTFVAGISSQRPSEAFIWINGSIPHWRSGPWDKSKFTGIPDMNPLYGGPFDLSEEVEKGTTYLHFNHYENSIVANMFLSSQGVLKIIQKDDHGGLYSNWNAPEGQCDVYGVCGPFGVCKDSISPICKCLKGFVPKSSQEWSKGNWTGGCVRRSPLLCENNTTSPSSTKGKRDRFWKIGKVKLPDFYEFMNLDDPDSDSCQMVCLENCSCLAYAYVNGIGCLVWSNGLIDIQGFSYGGEEIFLRLAHEELDGGEKIKIIIISLVAVFTCVIIGAMAFGLRRWKAKQRGNIKKTEKIDLIQENDSSTDTLQFSKQHDPTELPTFDFSAILVATNHFSPTNKLGQGGFGSVYKGKLLDGKEIAVKRLSTNSGQGIEEFKNEMILISKLQHRNLVRLMGYCIEKEEKLLVYEFMPNKSLDIFIFDSRKRALLNWATRLNIIHGVARGLVYLHRDSCLRVIHRDLKASNILLDEKMNPKISDFGLARMFQGTLDLANTQRVVGTLGYMSPEYAMGGIFSEKSDVFSFGVLLLEIVSGKKNTNFHYCDQHLSLIAYAWQLWTENRRLEFVDEALANSYSAPEAIRCIHVGLLCAQDHAADRPSMPDVVFMLSNEMNLPKPKKPIFTLQCSPKCDSQSQHDSRLSVNEATMSLIEGR